MSVIKDESGTEAVRKLVAQKSKPSPKKKRKKNPPNRVDPGWIHQAVGAGLLKLAQEIAESKGLNLKVGTVDLDSDPTVDDSGSEPADLAARLVAHAFHRLPGISRIEKQLEGQNKSSGMFSDLAALCAQLAKRNRPFIENQLVQAWKSFQASQDKKGNNSED